VKLLTFIFLFWVNGVANADLTGTALIVEETHALLDETDKLKDQRYASKDSIESAKQMKITAQGYKIPWKPHNRRYLTVLWSYST